MRSPVLAAPREIPRRDFIGRIAVFLAGTALLGRVRRSEASTQSIEPYLGEIMLISCSFAPKGWALCNGQLLPISQYQALFSLLGTTYGGNGATNFALPDLRGRVPIHAGTGPGLSTHALGEKSGEENHTLSVGEMPAHAHVLRGSSAAGISASPSGMFPARSAAQIPRYGATPDAALAATAISSVGGNQAHSNLQPSLALNYVIALQGVYPPHP
jgi:microcystin-dependent protein